MSRVHRHLRGAMLTLLCLAGTPLHASPAPAAGPGVAARVNGEPISARAVQRGVDAYLRARHMDAGGVFNPRIYAGYQRRVLDQLIGQELLWQAAHAAGVRVPAAEVAAVLTRERTAQPTEAAWLDALQANGYNTASFTEQTRRRLAVERYVRERLAPQVKVEESEIAARYEATRGRLRTPRELHLRQILLRLPGAADERQVRRVRGLLEQLRQAVREGGDFAALAREHSQGPHAANGGDLGFQPEDRLILAFRRAAHELAPGQVSPVFRTAHGWHLLRLEGRREGVVPPLAAVRERLTDALWREKLDAAIRAHLAHLRDQAKVRIYLK